MDFQINEQTFQMLLDRFDRVDKDNEEIMKSLTAHIDKDNEYYDMVDKHSTYWSLALWISGVALVSSITAWFKGLLR